jgi:hypothetical protein
VAKTTFNRLKILRVRNLRHVDVAIGTRKCTVDRTLVGGLLDKQRNLLSLFGYPCQPRVAVAVEASFIFLGQGYRSRYRENQERQPPSGRIPDGVDDPMEPTS